MQHNHLHLNLKLFQSLQNKQTTYQSPVQQERGKSLRVIFLRPSVAMIRLYSSHLADPHTRLSAASFHKEKFTIASSKLYTTSFLTSSHSCVCVYIYIYIILISFSHTKNKLIFQQSLKCLTRLFFSTHSAFFLFCHLSPLVPKNILCIYHQLYLIILFTNKRFFIVIPSTHITTQMYTTQKRNEIETKKQQIYTSVLPRTWKKKFISL